MCTRPDAAEGMQYGASRHRDAQNCASIVLYPHDLRLTSVHCRAPPPLSSRVPALGRWRRIEPGRAALMKGELERIMAAGNLSRDTFEQVSRSLEG